MRSVFAGERFECVSDRNRLSAADPFRAEIQREIVVRSIKTGMSRAARVARPCEARESRLDQFLGRKFERLNSVAQALHIRVGILRKASPQRAQRLHHIGSDLAARTLGRPQPIAAEPAASRDPEPQHKEHQVDVESVSVLQRNQRSSDARSRVKGQRKPP